MLGIFMVSLGACLLLTIYDKSEKHKRLWGGSLGFSFLNSQK
jgi:hypothetical protein